MKTQLNISKIGRSSLVALAFGAAAIAMANCTTNNPAPVLVLPTAAPTPTPQPPLGATPNSISLTVGGAAGSFTATESTYTGSFAASSTNCSGIATFNPPAGTGPTTSFSVTAVAAGTCQVIVRDTANQVAVVNVVVASATPAAPNALTVNPTSVSLTNGGSSLNFIASENSYTGTLTASSSTCSGIATFSPSSGTGPSVSFNVTAVAPGNCQIAVKDASNQVAVENVFVSAASSSTSTIAVTPGALTFTAAGANNGFTVSESGYTGPFTATSSGGSSCSGIATFTPSSGTGPSASFTVTSVAAGTCQISIADNRGGTAVVNVGVTTTAISISSRARATR